MPPDVDLLNLGVPFGATTETPWRITRVAKGRYYNPYINRQGSWSEEGHFSSHIIVGDNLPEDSDVITVVRDKIISVTPVSLDMTSRVEFEYLDHLLRE